jgi:hypothetical protein
MASAYIDSACGATGLFMSGDSNLSSEIAESFAAIAATRQADALSRMR